MAILAMAAARLLFSREASRRSTRPAVLSRLDSHGLEARATGFYGFGLPARSLR